MDDQKKRLGLLAPAPLPSPPAPPDIPGPIPRISTTPAPDEAFCTARYSTMRSLEMSGSFPLSDQAIDEAMTWTSPGNYALGYMEDERFRVFFVGRSDSDVRRSLHEWVGMPSRYERYASPAKAPWGVHRRQRFPVNRPALAAVGNAETSYTRFAYSYACSAEAAFEKECRNYDDFGGSGALDNKAPPTLVERHEQLPAQAWPGSPNSDSARIELAPEDGAPKDLCSMSPRTSSSRPDSTFLFLETATAPMNTASKSAGGG